MKFHDETDFYFKFPSLKGKNHNDNAKQYKIEHGQWWFWSLDIMENCVDKQHVRDAINTIPDVINFQPSEKTESGHYTLGLKTIKEKIREELGL